MTFRTNVAVCILFGILALPIQNGMVIQNMLGASPAQSNQLNRSFQAGYSFLHDQIAYNDLNGKNDQSVKGVIYGQVLDAESRASLTGASVKMSGPSVEIVVVSDCVGRFRVELPPGRYNITVEHSGYNRVLIGDILVGSGKEVYVTIQMTESSRVLGGVTVSSERGRSRNTMAMVSARRLRSQDASRFASGYYDPLRMVTSLPGVSAGNDDDNNQIIVRGNSPKGLLWRLEGIEIPNPNHLASGEGASGGAYSAITTNILSGFEFYTGAFPAEFGNATSGVMDLSLRSGNPTKGEYSLGVGVVGAEVSAEGPLPANKAGSWFVNLRYANFNFLSRYGIIDSDDVSIIPNSFDWGSKVSYSSGKAGNFEFFTAGGASKVGDMASDNADSIKIGADNDEFLDKQFFAVAGVKHTLTLPNEKTFIRTTIGLTWQKDNSDNFVVDTLLNKRHNYSESFFYPAVRASVTLNHKLSPSNTFRIGMSSNIVNGEMFAKRFVSQGVYDTLINSNERGWYNSYFMQWKYRPSERVEMVAGMHFFHSGITGEFVAEPRGGMKLSIGGDWTMNMGVGLHSRLEPLSIYNYRIRIAPGKREIANENLKATRAAHLTFGLSGSITHSLKATMEIYHQHLYKVPIASDLVSKYSILNAAYGLPDVKLVNNGTGRNSGIEFSLEKEFFRSSYFLTSVSLFDSRYKAPDGRTYNTYFNNGRIFMFTAGREFKMGREGRNILGFNIRALNRGGFRYTPVNTELSLSRKRVVYDVLRTYGKQLPDYSRIDAGVSYRLNRKESSWTFLVEVQNLTNRHNVVRRRFSYSQGKILTRDSYSVGIVPIFSVKVDF